MTNITHCVSKQQKPTNGMHEEQSPWPLAWGWGVVIAGSRTLALQTVQVVQAAVTHAVAAVTADGLSQLYAGIS